MDASYAITRVFAALEERGIEAVIPAKAERPPKRGTIPDCDPCRRRAIPLHKDHPALLRARRKYARWGSRERALANLQIQAFLTAAVINLKQLAEAVLLALLAPIAAATARTATGRRQTVTIG